MQPLTFRKLATIVLLLAPAATAQWQNVRTSGVPRLPDGKPNLSASAPKATDGNPDLSGIWNPESRFLRSLAVAMKPEDVPLQPWAEALYKRRLTGELSGEEPDANCLPQGVPKIDAAPAPWKVIQLPEEVVILYEAFTQFRQIFTDGRALPAEPNPAWFGYSVGRWEGDTLVVESNGFNGKLWLDQEGRPSTDALRVTERFRRKDFGHLEITITIDDPKAYTKPWTVVQNPTLAVDTELIEFICNENNKDIPHMPVSGKP